MAPPRESLHPNFQRDSPVSPLQTVSRRMSQKERYESRKNTHANVKRDSPLSPPVSENLKVTVSSAQEFLDSTGQRELSVFGDDSLTLVPKQNSKTSVSEFVDLLPQTSKQLHPDFLRDSPLSPIGTTSGEVSERKWPRSHPPAPESLDSNFQPVSPFHIMPGKFTSDPLFSEKKEFAVLDSLLSNFVRGSPLSPMQAIDGKILMQKYLASHQQPHINSERNPEFLVGQNENTTGIMRKRLFSDFEQDNFHLWEQTNSPFNSQHGTSCSSSSDVGESSSSHPRPDGYSPISFVGMSPFSPGQIFGTGLNNLCNDAPNNREFHRGVSDSPISIDSHSSAAPAIRLLNIIRNSQVHPKTPLQFSGIAPPRTCIIYRDPEIEKAIQEHQEARMPLVTDASKRLQEFLSVRNDNEFRPPVPPNAFASNPMELRNPLNCDPALRPLKKFKGKLRMDTGGLENLKKARAPQGPVAEWRKPQNPLNRGNSQSFGLRESLLMHGLQPYGKQCGTNLLSLSFHDVRPDMRTGAFKNELMAHIEADRIGGTKLMAYEVKIPMTEREGFSSSSKPQSGPAQTQRWLAFFISTPLITLAGTPTVEAPPGAFPGNLPNHPPNSWLVFAAPCNKIASYPRCKDNMAIKTYHGREIVREVQRLDFIFSRDGVPAFEFMDKASVLGPLGTQLQKNVGAPFLCARGLGKYNIWGDDKDTPASPLPQRKRGKRCNAAAIQARIDEDIKKWETRDVEDLGKSRWWTDVEDVAYEDAHKWMRIREAMARGCCRIVARFDQPGSGKGSGIWA